MNDGNSSWIEDLLSERWPPSFPQPHWERFRFLLLIGKILLFCIGCPLLLLVVLVIVSETQLFINPKYEGFWGSCPISVAAPSQDITHLLIDLPLDR